MPHPESAGMFRNSGDASDSSSFSAARSVLLVALITSVDAGSRRAPAVVMIGVVRPSTVNEPCTTSHVADASVPLPIDVGENDRAGTPGWISHGRVTNSSVVTTGPPAWSVV